MTDKPDTPIDDETLRRWADDLRGPVALTFRQPLKPVNDDGVIFPATYADLKGGYNIDTLADGSKVAQVDSVGAQANRMEPLFKKAPTGRAANPLASLVPQIEIDLGKGGNPVSLLDAGHRLGDAIVRASALADEARAAFMLYRDKGDASAIAKLAPTSLVFAAWDSRDTQEKLPRIVSSVIRAWDVEALTRSAQYNPVIDYSSADVLVEPVLSAEDRIKAEGDSGSDAAKRGYVHVPSVGSHGGVVARGGIWRDGVINLVALRQLGAADEALGSALRAYILGLALVAASEPQDGFLRQGCLLVPDADAFPAWTLIERTGARRQFAVDAFAVQRLAMVAAERFGVGESRVVAFDTVKAKADVKASSKKPKAEAKAK